MRYLCFILFVFLPSCCTKVDCPTPYGIPLQFRGFNLTDVDTIYTTGYAPGSGFTQITRDEQADTVETPYENDTVFYLRDKTDYILSLAHEWKIYIPSINRTLYISDYGYRTYTCNKCFLKKGNEARALSSCKLDGKLQDASALRVYK